MNPTPSRIVAALTALALEAATTHPKRPLGEDLLQVLVEVMALRMEVAACHAELTGAGGSVCDCGVCQSEAADNRLCDEILRAKTGAAEVRH